MQRKNCFMLQAIFFWIIWNQNIHRSEESQVRGTLGSSVTLPCDYNAEQHGILTTCWGRGDCSWIGCSNQLFQVTGQNTIPAELKSKYKLYGNLQEGNVSLTIERLDQADEGRYCCRVEIRGLGNDKIVTIDLTVVPPLEESQVRGTLGSSVTLPCDYNAEQHGILTTCWVRGDCSWIGCSNQLFQVTGQNTIPAELKSKYKLYGNLQEGNVSLTIERLDQADEGRYCCRVENRGLGNDKIVTIKLTVVPPLEESQVRGTLGSSVTLPCDYNAEQHGILTTCWGRGDCSWIGCSNQLFQVTGQNTIPAELKSKYKLYGNLQEGNVSLTIERLDQADEGRYCCRVENRGLGNDKIVTIKLTVVPPLEESQVRGTLGSSVTLPCDYNAEQHGILTTCWGRGDCSWIGCSNQLFQVTGQNTIPAELKSKYKLYGNLQEGNVSLTIERLDQADEGRYCCRVENRGLGNDKIVTINLTVVPPLEESQVRGTLGSSVTLPCDYNAEQHGILTTCWGRGDCSWIGCSNQLFQVTGQNTIPAELKSKYKLYGNLQEGNVSLTIERLDQADEGRYCCRVENRGLGNDKIVTIKLTVVPPLEKPLVCYSKYNSTNSTEECQSKAQSQQEDTSAFCNIISWTGTLKEKACNSSDTGFSLETLSNFSQRMLDDRAQWQELDGKKQHEAFDYFLLAMEAAVIEAGQTLLRDNKTQWSSATLGVEIASLHRASVREEDITTLGAKGNSMAARTSSLIGDGTSLAPVLLAFMSYSHLETMLHPVLPQGENNSSARIRFGSQVVTVTNGNVRRRQLSAVINITFRGREEGDVGGGRRFCANWKGSHWSEQGCEEIGSNKTHIRCSCSSLSSFAVLMALYGLKNPVHNFILRLITLIGLSISLLCLLLTMGTLFCFQSIRGLNTTIRAHLSLSLFFAELLFLISMFVKKQPVLCAVIAASLHYLFLVAFAWMFLEAVYLWFMVLNLKVVNFSRTRVMKRRMMYPMGYVCPALIVIVAATVNPRGYGNKNKCWLDLESGFIWSFLGPVCFVVLVNTILFSMILWILRNSIASLNTDVSTIKESRTRTFKAMAQFILLGCSWAFGFFQLKEETIVMSYLFTILNVAQGVFIFLIHCLMNPQVRREYCRWFNQTCRRKKAETTDTMSSPVIISQVTVLRTVDSNTTQADVQWMNMYTEK